MYVFTVYIYTVYVQCVSTVCIWRTFSISQTFSILFLFPLCSLSADSNLHLLSFTAQTFRFYKLVLQLTQRLDI